MKVETSIEMRSLRDVPAAARKAEEMGYDGVVSSQTGHDPFLPLALAAEHTQRLTLGTAVAIAFPLSPTSLAHIAWDLQALSGGRLLLGLGSQVKGHIVRRFGISYAPPGPRMREYVLALRAVWDCWQSGTKLNFQGDYYNLSLMTPYFNPGPIEHPRIPVYVSAVNPYMLRLAGEVCDGVRLHAFNTAKYTREAILPNLEAGARKAGRQLSDIDICGGSFLVTGETEEEVERAKQAVRTQVAFYGSTRSYRGVFEAHGWGDVSLQLHEMSTQGRWAEMGNLITEEMLEEFAIVSPYDGLIEKIKARWSGIVTRTGLAIPIRKPEDEERLRHMIRELQQA
jgi:probable F420-dependent oxidoreductase